MEVRHTLRGWCWFSRGEVSAARASVCMSGLDYRAPRPPSCVHAVVGAQALRLHLHLRFLHTRHSILLLKVPRPHTPTHTQLSASGCRVCCVLIPPPLPFPRRRSLHWARLLGLGLMLCGVALVTYFDGEEVGAAAAAKGQQPPLPSPSLPSSPQDTGAPSNATLTSSGTVSISGIAVADAPAGSPAGLAGTGESGGTGAGSRRRLMGALRALGCVLWGGVGREGDGWRGMRGRVGRRAAGAEARVEVALSGEVSRGDVEGKSGKEGVGGEVVVVELDEQEEGSAARDCVGTRREAGGALTP